MAQQTGVQYRSPKATNHNGLSETNNFHHNQLPPKPPASPNNQQNSTVQLQLPTSPDVQTTLVRVNEKHHTGQNYEHDKNHKFFKEIRGCLMTVAILGAGSTYQAGLNPPGGFWESNDGGHKAGNPILFDNFSKRYEAFYYCNGVSFVSSLAIIILLMNTHFPGELLRVRVLKVTMVLDLFSFMAAYAAGSCRSISASIVMFVLVGGVVAYVLIFAAVIGLCYPVLHKIASRARSGINRVRSGFNRSRSRINRAEV